MSRRRRATPGATNVEDDVEDEVVQTQTYWIQEKNKVICLLSYQLSPLSYQQQLRYKDAIDYKNSFHNLYYKEPTPRYSDDEVNEMTTAKTRVSTLKMCINFGVYAEIWKGAPSNTMNVSKPSSSYSLPLPPSSLPLPPSSLPSSSLPSSSSTVAFPPPPMAMDDAAEALHHFYEYFDTNPQDDPMKILADVISFDGRVPTLEGGRGKRFDELSAKMKKGIKEIEQFMLDNHGFRQTEIVMWFAKMVKDSVDLETAKEYLQHLKMKPLSPTSKQQVKLIREQQASLRQPDFTQGADTSRGTLFRGTWKRSRSRRTRQKRSKRRKTQRKPSRGRSRKKSPRKASRR